MPSVAPSTGLTITNPLVLYRALLATKKISPDTAQYRLCIHLEKLYKRLKDYEPEIEYSKQLDQITRTIGKRRSQDGHGKDTRGNERPRGILPALRAHQEKKDTLALIKTLTNEESAVHINSPKGILIYGEVGTGKSMLVNLLCDSLPNRKKRKIHFNTFMLEIFARLEYHRKRTLNSLLGLDGATAENEHSLLWLAREMITTSPILFLDEFQLPDRTASKILSSLLTSFFHLGGVLIATSNRMPEELANASGVEFAPPPSSRLGLLGTKWGILGPRAEPGRSENMFASRGDFSTFLEVLRARCEVWDIEGNKDWRRIETRENSHQEDREDFKIYTSGEASNSAGLEPAAIASCDPGYKRNLHMAQKAEVSPVETRKTNSSFPRNYFVTPSLLSSDDIKKEVDRDWETAVHHSLSNINVPIGQGFASAIPWETSFLHVYGRRVPVPRSHKGVTMWTFPKLCASYLGPADYISLASAFHTLILTDVPILTLLCKNEARRLITLLDALYEARCKLLIRAAAGPDEIFFPESQNPRSDAVEGISNSDGTYAETFSEIYQDQTSPFRPNISSYTFSSSRPSYDSTPLPSAPYTLPSINLPQRSILTDEDSDFGPVYGAGRSSSPHFSSSSRLLPEATSGFRNTRGSSDGVPGAGNENGDKGPNFQRAGQFTGEDERFAYKRARSRLWEMCGERWNARNEEGWWKPLSKGVRVWEGEKVDSVDVTGSGDGAMGMATTLPVGQQHPDQKQNDEGLFQHGPSPFRTSQEPPPKISWTHAWGMMTWGRKAGVWGKGVEGLKEKRAKEMKDVDQESGG